MTSKRAKFLRLDESEISLEPVNPWQELANAVIVAAAEDYRIALRGKRNPHTKRKPEDVIPEVEKFMNGQARLLTKTDPMAILERIRKENGRKIRKRPLRADART